jgi:hypothetical protein
MLPSSIGSIITQMPIEKYSFYVIEKMMSWILRTTKRQLTFAIHDKLEY